MSSRRIKTWLFIAIFTIGFCYLSWSASHNPNPPWYQRAAYRLVSPVAIGLKKTSGFVTSFYHHYLALRGAREENEKLKNELAALRGTLIQTQEENRQFSLRLGNAENLGSKKISGKAARVVGFDPSPSFRSMVLDVGAEQGVQKDQAVVAQGGLVGRVLKVSGKNSQVMLITDLNSSVDVLDEVTRARGTLVGLRKSLGLNRDQWLTQAEYVLAQEEIHPGDLLLTSGMDGVFPQGWPVGIVDSVKKDLNGLFWRAEVRPYVELNKVEEVVVLDQ